MKLSDDVRIVINVPAWRKKKADSTSFKFSAAGAEFFSEQVNDALRVLQLSTALSAKVAIVYPMKIRQMTDFIPLDRYNHLSEFAAPIQVGDIM